MNNQAVTPQAPGANVIQKLESLFNEVMKDSDFIPAILRPTVKNLVSGYLAKADPTQVKKIIRDLDETIIPWLLE